MSLTDRPAVRTAAATPNHTAPVAAAVTEAQAATTTRAPRIGRSAAVALGVTRILFGWTFLWAFADKFAGFGYATPKAGAWLNGGSPTKGFLSHGAKGPFEGFYHSIAGAPWADFLFMAALLGLGLALTLGIGMRIAGVAGAALYLMMFSVALPPVTNPLIDEHILGAATVAALALLGAGEYLGLGRVWRRIPLVRRAPRLI